MSTMLAESTQISKGRLGVVRRERIDYGTGVRVRVTNLETGKREFAIRLPLALAKIVLSCVPLSRIKELPQGIKKKDIYQILNVLKRAGLLVDVIDDGKHVQVRVGRISPAHFKEAIDMNEQEMQILKMLEEGKITAEEADKLLMELRTANTDELSTASTSANTTKMIRIRVFEGDLDKPKVRVSIPLSLAKFALRFVPKDQQSKISDMDIELDEIIRQIEEGVEGKLVEVDDTEDKTRVEIWVD